MIKSATPSCAGVFWLMLGGMALIGCSPDAGYGSNCVYGAAACEKAPPARKAAAADRGFHQLAALPGTAAAGTGNTEGTAAEPL